MAILARINHQLFQKKEKEVAIAHYLDERLITFLEVKNRNEALGSLVDLLDEEGKLCGRDHFFQAILERERIVSTGIGMGVAIPHAKIEGYEDFFIAVGVQRKVGLEWNALDGSLVRLIFMIGGPDNKQTEYLKILSRLTMAIKDEKRRRKMMKAESTKQIFDLLKEF